MSPSPRNILPGFVQRCVNTDKATFMLSVMSQKMNRKGGMEGYREKRREVKSTRRL